MLIFSSAITVKENANKRRAAILQRKLSQKFWVCTLEEQVKKKIEKNIGEWDANKLLHMVRLCLS